MISRNLLLTLLLCVILQQSNSARILGFFSTPSRSHLIIHESLMRELAIRGHDVTVITPFKQITTPLKNYRYIEVSEIQAKETDDFAKSLMKGKENNENFFKQMPKFINSVTERTSDLLRCAAMEKLKTEKFDLVIFGLFMNDFQIGLAKVFDCPSILLSVLPGVKLVRDYVGNPSEMSTVPNLFVQTKSKMTFPQRVASVLFNAVEAAMINILHYFVMEPLYREHFPPEKFPSFDESRNNVSLVLINQHFSQAHPQALVPAMIEFSGMHIKRKPDPLPENMQKWLDDATDGAIIFSMGSNARSSDLSEGKLEAILRTFAKLKQRILWKFEEDLPNKPDNVMISKWLPQDDVLAHPNVKLFISHCGKGGMSEAKYHGVPVLGLPIFGDQDSNVADAVAEGWAIHLEYSNLNEEIFTNSLLEMLNNPKYGQAVKKLSMVFRDRPLHPLDNAAFWVEYVIRHQGAKHMQSPGVHLNFIQYYSLDVFAFLAIISYLVFKISKCFLKMLFRKIFGKSQSSTKNVKNKNKRD